MSGILHHLRQFSTPKLCFHGCQSHRARRETVQGAAGQAGHDVHVADGEDTISGKLKVESGNPERHGCRSHRTGRDTVQGVAGQGGHDVRVADGEGEVGVSKQRLLN